MGLKIGLVQINNSFSGQNYLPYSIACLQSYVEEHAERSDQYEFLEPIFKRIPIHQAVDRLKNADLVGFSTYVWNEQISLETARRLRRENPNCLIIFGGPQVPDSAEKFLREHEFIDLVVHNEGERTFKKILDLLPDRNFEQLAGVSFINKDGEFRNIANGPRIRNLSEVPSPFLNGIFDRVMKANPDEKWIGLWETNRGCPFKCTFCDWGSATAAAVSVFEIERLYKEIDWFTANKIEYIFVCDANFGIKKRDIDIAQYVATSREKTGYPNGFSVQNTKNATERAYETQKILADAGLNKGVALSMQSLDEDTLSNIKRDNISLDTYWELQSRFSKDKVETYSDLILGLPGETYDSFVDGIDMLMEAGQHNRIQFNNLSILPNAEIASEDYIEKFNIQSIKSEIINIHGSKEELDDDVMEYQELVISTASMPLEMWRKTRAFSWMAAFLHFNKIFQIPLVIAHETTGVSYRSLLEAFIKADKIKYPLMHEIVTFFEETAQNIQNGEPEYIFSADWLNIYWPADEYVFIKLTEEERMHEFYAEAEELLLETVQSATNDQIQNIVKESIKLNSSMIHQPYRAKDDVIELNYNIHAYYKAVLDGVEKPPLQQKTKIRIERSQSYYDDFQKWCQEIVWWGNKKGAYLYSGKPINKELAGHF